MPIEATVQADEFLKYFGGGREGVQRRFGEAIREGLKKLSAYDLFLRINKESIDARIIADIAGQNYGEVTKDIVELYQDSLSLDIHRLFGNLFLTGEERRKLARKALEDSLPEESPIDDSALNRLSDTQLRLYLITSALGEL